MTKVLIAEDDPSSLYMLRSLLEGSGYRVDAVPDGLSAIEAAREEPPDLLITDLMMPGMDGFALCRVWMRDPQLWTIPVIAYTGTYVSEEDRQLALDLGVEEFLVKPAEPDQILASVRAALTRAGREALDGAAALPDLEFFQRYVLRLRSKLKQKVDQMLDTEQELQQYVRRSESILNASPIGVFSFDREGRITSWNLAAERMLGYSEVEAVGCPIDLLAPDLPFAPGSPGGEPPALEAEPAKFVRREARLMHKDGRSREVSLDLVDTGPEVDVIGFITDQGAVASAKDEVSASNASSSRPSAWSRSACSRAGSPTTSTTSSPSSTATPS